MQRAEILYFRFVFFKKINKHMLGGGRFLFLKKIQIKKNYIAEGSKSLLKTIV